MGDYVGRYCSDELRGRLEELTEVGHAEEKILGCLVIASLKRIIDEAKLQADRDKTRGIKPEHLSEARDIVLK